MITRVVLGEIPWQMGDDPVPPHIKAAEKRFLELFAAYSPQPSADTTGSYSYPVYELLAPAGDPEVKRLLGEFDSALKSAKRPGAAYFVQIPTSEEVSRARFIQPGYSTWYVNEGPSGELNPDLFACEQCGYPNFTQLPRPLLVSKAVLKQYDVFHTGLSFLVVRQWVLKLLEQVVGGQFQSGPVAVAKAKEKLTGENQLFWLRPKAMLGAAVLQAENTRTCEACHHTTRYPGGGMDHVVNTLGPGLADGRVRAAHLGAPGLEIALLDKLTRGGEWPEIVMSGALLACLKAKGVKGISAKRTWPECVFSVAGEPALQAQERQLGAAAALAQARRSQARLEAAKTTAQQLKDWPWDCDKEGYVYFHLSTPKFVALDPMTAEDSGSPCEVKHFKGPGVYRLPVSAIKRAGENGIAVDSATLLFVDNAFLSELLEHYEWDKAMKGGEPNWAYHQQVAEQAGTRFGVCTVPPKKFKSAFKGDGFYRIDAIRVRPATLRG